MKKVRGTLDKSMLIRTRVLELYEEFIENCTFSIAPGDLFRYGRYADTDYVNQERLEAEARAKEKQLAWQAALDIVSLEEEINNPRSSNGQDI